MKPGQSGPATPWRTGRPDRRRSGFRQCLESIAWGCLAQDLKSGAKWAHWECPGQSDRNPALIPQIDRTVLPRLNSLFRSVAVHDVEGYGLKVCVAQERCAVVHDFRHALSKDIPVG